MFEYNMFQNVHLTFGQLGVRIEIFENYYVTASAVGRDVTFLYFIPLIVSILILVLLVIIIIISIDII